MQLLLIYVMNGYEFIKDYIITTDEITIILILKNDYIKILCRQVK